MVLVIPFFWWSISAWFAGVVKCEASKQMMLCRKEMKEVYVEVSLIKFPKTSAAFH